MPKRPLVATLALLSACATGARTADPEPNTQVTVARDGFHVSMAPAQRTISAPLAAPVAEVWAVLPAVLEEAGFPGAADAATRTVTTHPRMVRGRVLDQPLTRLVDCGRGQFGAEYAATNPVRIVLRATVQPGEGSGSRLETVVEAAARGSSGADAVLAPCRSLGALEEGLAARVRARLPG